LKARHEILNGTFSDDVPSSDYPGSYAGLPDVIDDFSCGEWAVYLKRNREKLGVARTKEIMLIDFSNIGYFNFEFNNCELHCPFTREVGLIDPDSVSFLGQGICDVNEAIQDVTGAIVDTTGTTRTVLKIALWSVPVVAAIFGVVYAKKKGYF